MISALRPQRSQWKTSEFTFADTLSNFLLIECLQDLSPTPHTQKQKVSFTTLAANEPEKHHHRKQPAVIFITNHISLHCLYNHLQS